MKAQDRRVLSYSTPIIPDNTCANFVKNIMGRSPNLDEETFNNYFQIVGTLWNRVGVPLVREPAFDIHIVIFWSN